MSRESGIIRNDRGEGRSGAKEARAPARMALQTLLVLSLSASIIAACNDGPTRPKSPSDAGLVSSGSQAKKGGNGGGGGGGTAPLSYELTGGFTASLSGPPGKDNHRQLSSGFVVDIVTIDFPSVEEADCTFGANVTSQATKDALLALTQQVGVQRQINIGISKTEGTGGVLTKGPEGESPHVHMCVGTNLGNCPFTFVGTDINDATTRREFQFAGGGNNALRLHMTEGSANTFTGYEAICMNDDPVTIVVEPAAP